MGVPSVGKLKVFERVLEAAGRKTDPGGGSGTRLPREPLAAFKGLLVAGLIAMVFWGVLILLLLRWK
jgi:hypothetical protein